MQELSRFQRLSRFEPRRGRAVAAALGALLVAVALVFAAAPAGAAAPTDMVVVGVCPSFRVLHDDRIGAASFPAGSYNITNEDASLSCKASAELFARFLEDYDGVLPTPWKVLGEGSGKASFTRGAAAGFSVVLTKKEEGGANPDLGVLCNGTFMVNSTTVVGPLRFTKGKFLIYLPSGSGITCNRASVLFTRFLGAGGPLLPPWKLINQTATFYKPSNPTRSAFRIEPLAGSGGR
jgi:hypothetical protein